MGKISFRAATEEDREFVRQLSAGVFSVFGDYDEVMTRWFLQPRVSTVIGSMNGSSAGFAILQLAEKGKWHSSTGELLALAVIPEYHRQGIGGALLEYVEKMASQVGLNKIRLHTAVDNMAARNLFEKAGYRRVGSEKSYYPKGQSAVMMVKTLAT